MFLLYAISIVVMKVQRHERKLKSRLGLGKLTRKVLRLLKADVKFPVSSIGQKKIAHEATIVDKYHVPQREIKIALLNAEGKRAHACMMQVLMERQRRLQLY